MSTAHQEGPPGLDLLRLGSFFDDSLPGLRHGPLDATLLVGGLSNLTYRVTDGHSVWVVRRPPLGHVLATAHDMAREYAVISALRDSAVPVPPALRMCEDAEVIGAPFYVMEFVPGRAYGRAADLGQLGAERVRSLALKMMDVLTDLHAIEPAAVGLADFGRPEGFLERQVRRWSKQLDSSRSRDVPGIDELAQRLAAQVPVGDAAALIHGDYRLDNLLVDGDRIAAVVDWEMATLGDPLTDVGLLVVYQRLSRSAVLLGDAALAPGYPDEDDILARYAERSGRDLGNLGFYIALASFKLAVILEGIYLRHRQGKTVGPGFEGVAEAVPPLVDAGLTALPSH